MKIQKTTDYKQFKTLKGNREVRDRQVRKLMNAIDEKNLLPQNPIIVNDKMEVIDGQHRLEAAKRLKIEIFYIVQKGGNLTDTHTLNATQKNWLTADYVDSYVEQGKEDYKWLKSMQAEHGVSLSNLIFLSFGKEKDAFWYQFRTGQLRIDSNARARALRMLEIANTFEPFCEQGVTKSRDFLRSLQVLVEKGVKLNRLQEKLAESGIQIRRQVNVTNYLRVYEDALNFRVSKNQVRLY